MTDRRALLTDREREIVAEEADVSDAYRYQTISRIRSRFGRLAGDIEALGEHGELLEEFRAAVCDDVPGSAEETASVRGLEGADPKGPAGGNAPAHRGTDAEEVSATTRELLEDELAGGGDLLSRRVDAVLCMYDLLRDRGEAEKAELLATVDADAVGYQSEASVWSNMVKGKDTLRALSGVEPPSTGRTVWQYNG